MDAVNLVRLLRCTEQMACVSELDRDLLAAHLLELHALHRRVDVGQGDALSAAEVDDARRRIRLLDELLPAERPELEPKMEAAGSLSAAPRAVLDAIACPSNDAGARGMRDGETGAGAAQTLSAGRQPAATLVTPMAPSIPTGTGAVEDTRPTAARRRRAGAAGQGSSAGSAGALEQQRSVHDALLEDTAEMVARLKHNSLLAQRALAADNATLDLTEDAASANVSKVDAEARRILATRRAMRANCCTNWLIGLVVLALFMLTLVFIRLFPAPRR